MPFVVGPDGIAIEVGEGVPFRDKNSIREMLLGIPKPSMGPQPPTGPVTPTTEEELERLRESLRQRPKDPEFENRKRPGRGKRMDKLSGRLRLARLKGGKAGQAFELATTLGNRALFGRGAGMMPGNVSMLRGLGGLGALAALGYFGGKTAYDIVQGETDLLGTGKRTQALANLSGQASAEQYEASARARRMASAMESQRMQRSIMENLQQVAQNNPALYNQVSAGRKLPRGAVVLGGQQRQDLLTELARAMDSGSFRQQDPLSDLIG